MRAYRVGLLGDERIPEDNAPAHWHSPEERLAYFTLPMSVNYRRLSESVWRAALAAARSADTAWVFDPDAVCARDENELRQALTGAGLALQPTRHTLTWATICRTVAGTWGSFTGLLADANHDVRELQRLVQHEHKRGFPYLSGPKLFNYWCFLLELKGGVSWRHADAIDLAVDSHVYKASVRLGVVGAEEKPAAVEVARRWRAVLDGCDVHPTDLNLPLWAWSRSGFVFDPWTGARQATSSPPAESSAGCESAIRRR